MTFDKEKVSFNLARIKKHGMTFEVVVDPDLAMNFKDGKSIEVTDLLKSEDIFTDAKKGNIAPDETLIKAFGTDNALKVANIILTEGEIQVTSEYREKKREEKKKRILELIHINAVDAQTGLPHPMTRLENAWAEAKIRVDDNKKAEDQIHDIVTVLRPILPIKFDVKRIEVHVPATYAAKMYPTIKNFGKFKKEDWLNDGSWKVIVEIPAGLQDEFFDELNSKTHGSVETKILD
ncbi:MAG: ribosome assembly factor SBDS [Nanoarchaeota archaeon]|nr:ribosome assembly factor SBDS [Nanoarchaeota archaeon]